jgi:hypothetical protein
MTRLFEQDGISFHYPEDWKLEREENENGWTVLLQSPQTAFVTVTLDTNLPPAEQMVQETLEALRSDYPALEAEPCIEPMAGEMAIGHNINFFSLDLTNTCYTRSFYTAAGTVLVLCQTNDLELEEYEPVFRALWKTMRAEVE